MKWHRVVVVVSLLGSACRAPLVKKPDRVYVPVARNSATAPAVLYNRLGEEKGIRLIVEDFVPRVMGDSRVNFLRVGTARASATVNVVRLQEHFVQYISGASGGPGKYEGRDMLAVHQGMGISSREFDAFLEDLGLSMQKVGVEQGEREDLIQIMAGTRGMIVEKKGS